MPKSPSHPRFIFLDAFRGFLVINMILYHFLWDLVFLKGMNLAWYRDYTLPATLWQAFIRFFFIFISGYCLNLSNRPMRRGLELTVCGALITAVTLAVMPENAIIYGVLTFLGSAALVGTPVRKKYHGDTPLSILLLLASVLCYIVTRGISFGYIGLLTYPLVTLPSLLYRGYFMTFLGFLDPDFYSTDYVPLLPWIFVYFAGFFLGRITLPVLKEKRMANAAPAVSVSPDGLWKPLSFPGALLAWTGRHSLLIYMVHQPVLAGITYLLMFLD